MAAYIKVCDGDCGASGGACDGGECPSGYFCSSAGFENSTEENRETACLRGKCINIDGQESGAVCSRCDAGYAIVQWDDSMKTNKNSDNCEFITDNCPRFCPEYYQGEGYFEEEPVAGVKCNNGGPSTCGCKDVELTCQDFGTEYTYTCLGSTRNACPEFELDGENFAQLITGRPKNTSNQGDRATCCSCLFCTCPGTCVGSCLGDYQCPGGQICVNPGGNSCPFCETPNI